MAETTDDLSTPLGQAPARKRRFRLPFSGTQAITAVLGLILITFLGFVLFNDNPLGGEPVARVAIRQAGTGPAAKAGDGHEAPAPAVKSATEARPAGPAGQRTVTMIDGSTGARHDVTVSGEQAEKSEPGTEPAPPVMNGINSQLLEKSRYGMIPVAADGLRPVTAYAAATDADRAKAANTPSIAIVVGGLGVGAAKTTDAIMKLPGAVTLAFTPYGSDPGKLVERARAQHHEVLLQIPLEPFDYPDNDPGPQTLLTSISAEQNLDRLFWHLSRFQGYVGVANYMGGRYVATDGAMQSLIRELARRGLGYLDDGSTARSVAPSLAEDLAMPFAKADLTIDAIPTSIEIDRALAKLESMARDHGSAVGMASALPISIERLNVWARSLASHGVALVPLTTVMLKSKSS
jgi:polysaccharide deacetylase 2 family uncharacterized protein YibQ